MNVKLADRQLKVDQMSVTPLRTLASILKRFMNFIQRSKIRLKFEDVDSFYHAPGLIFLVSFPTPGTTWGDLIIRKNTVFHELL